MLSTLCEGLASTPASLMRERAHSHAEKQYRKCIGANVALRRRINAFTAVSRSQPTAFHEAMSCEPEFVQAT